MDQIGILAGILIASLIIIALRGIIQTACRKKSAKQHEQLVRIGDLGETRLYNSLSAIPGSKKLLRHLYLPTGEDGRTTEIDLVMIHRTGIYVFESKNYSGYIKGRERKKRWIQVTRSGKRPFYNPIMQNAGHIRVLRRILYRAVDRSNSDPVAALGHRYHSIIVFGNHCNIERVRIRKSRAHLVHYQDVEQLCRELMQRRACYSSEQIRQIAEILSNYTNVKKQVIRNHVKDINKRYPS